MYKLIEGFKSLSTHYKVIAILSVIAVIAILAS